MSAPPSSRCVANECRSTCGVNSGIDIQPFKSFAPSHAPHIAKLNSVEVNTLFGKNKMAAIHVIQRKDPTLPRPTPLGRASVTYRSGNWLIAEQRALSLINGIIYFHRSQAAPSFFGGKITAVQKLEDEDDAGRVVFTFVADQACKNVRTPRDGWSQEMKIIDS